MPVVIVFLLCQGALYAAVGLALIGRACGGRLRLPLYLVAALAALASTLVLVDLFTAARAPWRYEADYASRVELAYSSGGPVVPAVRLPDGMYRYPEGLYVPGEAVTVRTRVLRYGRYVWPECDRYEVTRPARPEAER